MQSHKRTRKSIVFLMLIFIIPILASWILFNYHDHFQLKTTNHGILVNPPLHLKNVAVLNDNQKKWLILYVSENHCDSRCENTFHLLNQVKKALGKNTDRVMVKKILPEITFEDENNNTISDHHLRNENISELTENNFVMSHKIYLIDPIGNLFMYYQDTINPMDILKDLKRVLEVSQIG